MTKFVVTKKAPSNLKDDELVLDLPDFSQQIEENAGKAGIRKLTQRSHLKEIIGSVVSAYDPDNFQVVYANVAFDDYVGIAYENNKDLSNVITRIFTKAYPAIFPKYLDFKIKSRPVNTKTIFFTGPEEYTSVFLDNGIDRENLKGHKNKDD